MSRIIVHDNEYVYTYLGKKTHLLSPGVSVNSFSAALCGMVPSYPWTWLGTGTEEEYKRAQDQEICKRCKAVLIESE